MTYGTSSLDIPKAVVLASCVFNVFMTFLIATNPLEVIASPNGGGWWDPLQTILANSEDAAGAAAVAIYPRIWATSLLLILVVRLNWVFTVETAPSLYRCVLMTYLLPFGQYCLECFVYQTLPLFDVGMAAFMVGPWIPIAVNYSKYTKENAPGTTTTSKKKK